MNEMSQQVKGSGLSKSQVAWAMRHDWFVRTCRCQPSDNTQGFVIGVVVRQEDVMPDGKVEVENVVFTGFDELRAWAGY